MKAEDVMKAKQLREEGWSYQKIGNSLGFNRETIRCNLDPVAGKRHLESGRRYRQEHHDKELQRHAKYREAHREKLRQRAAEYRQTHRDEKLKRHREYNQAHYDEIRKRNQERYRQHKEEYKARAQERRAFLAGALVGATAEQNRQIAEIYRRAREDPKVRCYLCGKLIPLGHRHVDHIVPLSKGGKHVPSNLAIACDKCNLSKQAKLPEEMGLLL